MDLHGRIPGVEVHRGLAAEQQGSPAPLNDCLAGVVPAVIDGDRFLGHARLDQGHGHPVGGPRFLGTRLQAKACLQRDSRQPERMHAGRIAWEHGADYIGLALIAERPSSLVRAVASGENAQIQPAGQGIEDIAHFPADECELVHVGAAHGLRQAGRGGLLLDEVVRSLARLAERQFGFHEEVAGPLHALDKFPGRHGAQRRLRAGGVF